MNDWHRSGVYGFAWIFLLIGILLISCKDIFNSDGYNIKSVELNPSEALPLAYGSLSISDILSSQDSQYIKVYPDGLVYLDYDKTLRSQSIRDLVTVKDKSNIAGTLNVPPGTYPPSTKDINSTRIVISDNFNLDPEKLTEILLKSGRIDYSVTLSKPNANLKFAIKVQIPEFKDAAGDTLTFETTGNSGSFQLANYKYTSATPNGVKVIYTLLLKKNSSTVVVTAGTNVNASISFKSLDYKYIKGFLGDQTASLNAETVNIDAFGNSLLDDADVSFAQPKVELQVINQVGVPTDVSFTTLEARKPANAPLVVQINPASPIKLLFPTVMGDSAITNVTVTNSKALLDYAPRQFFYKASAEINKGLVTGNNFITDTSQLKVRMHIEVPLYGRASNIVLADTVEIDLSDADRSEITDASLKVKTTNKIPLDANLQLYLADDKFKIIDSLLAPSNANLIKASQVNASGEFASEGLVDDMVPLSKGVLKKLFVAKNIIIKAKVNTTKNGNTFPDVKFKIDYKLDVKLGLKVNAKVKVDL